MNRDGVTFCFSCGGTLSVQERTNPLFPLCANNRVRVTVGVCISVCLHLHLHLCPHNVCVCDRHSLMHSFNTNQNMLSWKESVIVTIQLGPLGPKRRAKLLLKFKWVCNIFNSQFHLQEIHSKMRYKNESRSYGKTQKPSAHCCSS